MKKSQSVIDLRKAIELLLKDKRSVIIYCLAGAVIGLVIAFSIPRIYKTKVMLAPESSNGSSLISNMSSLASMVGVDMAFGDGNDAIYPEIYPDLMSSMDFLVSLFPIKVESLDKSISTSYYDYMKNHQKIEWWNYPKVWIIDLIKKMKSDDKRGSDNKINPFLLTKDQFDIAKNINSNIDCSVEKKTSVISIEVTAQDPLISATLADSIKNRLQTFITDYRTKKARHDLAYMEQLYKEAKEQYAKARQRYAAYSDANQDLILESYRAKQEDLENEMQLQYNIYTQVVQQLQIAKAKVQERTPAFTVVQSASVPVKHSNKPKIFILITFMALAFITRCSILMYKNRTEIFRMLP